MGIFKTILSHGLKMAFFKAIDKARRKILRELGELNGWFSFCYYSSREFFVASIVLVMRGSKRVRCYFYKRKNFCVYTYFALAHNQ